jgi:alkylhydroperoxidase family enzyme
MLAYAERLTRAPSSVSEDQIHELRATGWSDRAIHDMAQVIAYYNYVNRVADGLGVTLEQGWPETWPE